ncbi:hypothetical protein COCMIDRAFT_83393 [Bipolaris oryzae ATCC 44560]|uniref:Uncharacterized protein n=1 Tax=Bipolaris oryzae ATCC 44560 TaxID=930090 RepID=W6ZIR9_COCMI|nr:uncharacterized protein COCMIDRAFT_83393 [Bipolaris oryzae ATCC 44560]EUC49885.1 hypothetical protein COCMIDRAFT_83393 [Bipolaris oryzae ATCC 44560]
MSGIGAALLAYLLFKESLWLKRYSGQEEWVAARFFFLPVDRRQRSWCYYLGAGTSDLFRAC